MLLHGVGRILRLAPRLAALLALSSGALTAQQGTITGRVADAETGQVLSSAQVFIRGGGGTLSNAQGMFRLSAPSGTQTLVVQLVGYAASEQDVDVPANGTVNVDISLRSTVLAVEGVTVTSNRSQRGERVIEATQTTDVITSIEIGERPTFNPADHLRSAPGVDVITTGLQGSNVVVRGFNNIFSGSLHMLSDYRLAGVPSLRVNLMHFIPTTDEDIDRMEVVLGPGSALYGPNTANGVVHMLSKSPLDDQGTSVTLGSGAKGTGNPTAFTGSFRSAFLLSEQVGLKLSGQYLNAEEWAYIDPAEQAGASFAAGNPARCQADKVVRGLSAAAATAACARIGMRNFDIERWSMEARGDWRYSDDGTFVATYGRNSSSGIELTGLGAGQTDNWVYEFFQGRLSKGRFFTQAYYNTSDAGDSFLLRDGVNLVDESALFVAQAQHGFAIAGGRQDFTYGVDFFGTRPNSNGTIYGAYEDQDNMDEWGFYVQSKTALTPQLDLIAAGRMDSHSILPDDVFSPRAALVFKPSENHGIRLSYNQAFSTPSALNFFLDVSGGLAPDPLGSLGFTTRAYGSGPDGWSLRGPDGTYQWMRSPFYPGGADQLTPADMSLLWPYFVGILEASGGIDNPTANYLRSLTPTNADILRLAVDPTTRQATPLAALSLPDLPPTVESKTESIELGWTGVLSNRVSISADVYYTKKNDFVSPLLVQTPLISLNPADIATFLTPYVGAAQAAQIAAAGGTPTNPRVLPLGVVSSDEVGARGADLILSYRNVGDIDLWGGDVAFQAFLDDQWSVSGTYSFVSEDYFDIGEGLSPIALNSPTNKGSVGLAYRNAGAGVSASTRVRFNSEFPAESAGYVGTRCLPTSAGGIFEEDCVESSAIVDLTASYRVPTTSATLQLSVTNLFDSDYRSFVGVPQIGRFTMLRVKYDFF